MAVGGTLGILFVTLLRRVMVEDPDLPFPESVAAAEIHKAGQQGSRAAKILFANMGFGGLVFLLGAIQHLSADRDFFIRDRRNREELLCASEPSADADKISTGAVSTFPPPPSARPTWVWATSSDRGWPHSILLAACSPGDCSCRSSFTFLARA